MQKCSLGSVILSVFGLLTDYFVNENNGKSCESLLEPLVDRCHHVSCGWILNLLSTLSRDSTCYSNKGPVFLCWHS